MYKIQTPEEINFKLFILPKLLQGLCRNAFYTWIKQIQYLILFPISFLNFQLRPIKYMQIINLDFVRSLYLSGSIDESVFTSSHNTNDISSALAVVTSRYLMLSIVERSSSVSLHDSKSLYPQFSRNRRSPRVFYNKFFYSW